MAETKEEETAQEQEDGQEQETDEQQEDSSSQEQSAAQQQEEESDLAKAGEEDDNAKAHLIAHLKDTHALEVQSIRQLERAAEILDSEDSDIAEGYKKHLDETQEHEEKIKNRIESYDLKPSAVKDLTMRAGAIGLRQLADIHPDTPVKLAMHFYAFEHLEIATYELLARIADAADDNETAEAAKEILEQEREAAEMVGETFDKAAEMMLEREPQTDPEDLPEGQGKASDEESEEENRSDEDEGGGEEGRSSEDEGSDEEDRSDEQEDSDEEESSSEPEGGGEEESSEEERSTRKSQVAGDKRPAG
jgi:ferritin-like metal-binding protein YciE